MLIQLSRGKFMEATKSQMRKMVEEMRQVAISAINILTELNSLSKKIDACKTEIDCKKISKEIFDYRTTHPDYVNSIVDALEHKMYNHRELIMNSFTNRIKRFFMFRKEIIISILFFFMSVSISQAGHKHSERYYQEIWCTANDGASEVVLSDGTRSDCETPYHSLEVDFGSKWYEGVTQSLHYALKTGKRAGLLIIIENRTDEICFIKATALIDFYGLPIDIWEIRP